MKVADPDRLTSQGSLVRERVSLILEPRPFEFGQCLLGRPLYSLVLVLECLPEHVLGLFGAELPDRLDRRSSDPVLFIRSDNLAQDHE